MELGRFPAFQFIGAELGHLGLIVIIGGCIDPVDFQALDLIIVCTEIVNDKAFLRVIEIQKLPGNTDLHSVAGDAVVCVGVVVLAVGIGISLF